MASVALQHEPPTDSSFVGQVLHRSSPVLTWRPARVLKVPTPVPTPTLRLDEVELIEVPEESRVSRIPTRRVVAWPVVPSVERKETRSEAWSIAAHVTIALVLACGFALGIVALDSDPSGVARSGLALRDDATHVIETEQDTLAAEPLAPPPSVSLPSPVAARPHKATPAHGGAKSHGHPAAPSHPSHAPHAGARTSRTAHR
jgi:hypothetical protein